MSSLTIHSLLALAACGLWRYQAADFVKCSSDLQSSQVCGLPKSEFVCSACAEGGSRDVLSRKIFEFCNS